MDLLGYVVVVLLMAILLLPLLIDMAQEWWRGVKAAWKD